MKKIYNILFKVFSKFPGSSVASVGNVGRIFFLKKIARSVGEGCLIRSEAIINKPENFSIGKNSGIGFRAIISCEDSVVIGDRVLMGPDVIIYTTNHIWSENLGTYYKQGLLKKMVSIGDDTWLGARCVILPGISIGRGVTVAAGAIVTKDVPDFSIVGGVPAKIIGVKNGSLQD